MKYKITPVVEIIIKWDDDQFDEWKRFLDWIDENEIFYIRGRGSWRRSSRLYYPEDAEKVEAYLKKHGRKNQLLRG